MTRNTLVKQVLLIAASMVAIACSNSSSPPAGSGGQGTGGGVGSGGKTGSGGASAGGQAGNTSPAGTGGSSSTGGSQGGSAGGTATAGGSSGKGGSATGGAGGSGGLASDAGPAAGGASTDGGSGRDAGAAGSGGQTGGVAGQVGGAGGLTHPDGGPGAGGAGGGAGYSPCKSSPCKILPLGDSITVGVQSSDGGGYREPLFKLIVAANQSATFVGTQMGGPTQVSGKTFPRNHEGYSGYTVESGYSTYGTPGISDKIPTPAFTTMPDIVLLHIGTNDLTSSNAKSTTADRLDTLLTKIAGAAPDALIVVAKLIPLGYGSSDWDNYNAKVPTIVAAHAAKGQHMISVDMSKLPSSQLVGVHPNDQGYSYMANIWYEAIKGLLPQ